ncbi:interleukin-36 beta-like [Lutra lutra]|uniref:interleukin-36 beta-like n=1 Tax=Lutra lutra TaxID=9657 RepID=UPI001FD3D975|nr:interleukin-36 beta-like [Lutra lutra]XP_047601787.1 interleukin-36 beta-like [Lutra lutra]XP_047601788.1 interleukin-36 beta-like [Lutra lutra]XP_047601789.1 interleukin-36 beta-like [Lutra lutra]
MATPQAVEFPRIFGVHDSQQMVWILRENSLIATPFSSNVKPVSLDLITCTDKEFHDAGKGNPVYLGIKGNHLCFFCAEIQGQPTLQLKEKKIMDMSKEKKAQKPFLFFHSREGSTSTFQSVSYPDWFIATSKMAGQPVILTKERGKNYTTNFYLEPEDYIQPVRA